MNTTSISEPVSEKRRRGRPRSYASIVAEEMRKHSLIPESCGSERSRINVAYRMTCLRQVKLLLSADEQQTLLGFTWEGLRTGKESFPRGWDSAANEIGRFLAEDETDRDYLLVAVNARRDGVSWRAIRSHFRTLRLGERCGNSLSLLIELTRAVDDYRSRFPATTHQMITGAANSLLEVVSEQSDSETGSLKKTDLQICVL